MAHLIKGHNSERIETTKLFQFLVLDALHHGLNTQCPEGLAIFHGGTSLSLVHGSPRFSEDLDFMVCQGVDAAMKAIKPQSDTLLQAHIGDYLPGYRLGTKGKFRNGMHVLEWSLQQAREPSIRCKVEFYVCEREALGAYPAAHRDLVREGVGSSVSPRVLGANLDTLHADKLNALAFRPHLKWRDLYDVWWMRTQKGLSVKGASTLNRMIEQLAVYAGDAKAVGKIPERLRAFIDSNDAHLLASAENDLKPFLPQDELDNLGQEGIKEMIAVSKEEASTVLKAAQDHRIRQREPGLESPSPCAVT